MKILSNKKHRELINAKKGLNTLIVEIETLNEKIDFLQDYNNTVKRNYLKRISILEEKAQKWDNFKEKERERAKRTRANRKLKNNK